MKRIILILLSFVILLTACSMIVFADDNAQSGSGDTQGAATGYAWYSTYQYLWKVTLFVGRTDQATKQSDLSNDFYRVGTIVMKKTGWDVDSSVKFASGTKVDYYIGVPMTLDSSPKIVSDLNCPAIPIVCDGDIETVKAYFGTTGTMTTILNAIANDKRTTTQRMMSALSFSIGGVTKSGWDYEYIAPNGTSNRVPWVIVYEPMVILNLKDWVTKLAFTATEFALCELNGWYDWNKGGGSGQNCAILPERHMPTSVQLEEPWFGYPVYNVTSDAVKWDYHDVVKGGGWGMRWLSAAVKEPESIVTDYQCYFKSVDTPAVDGYGTVQVTWLNNKTETGTVICELYKDSSLVWSGYKTLVGGGGVCSTFNLRYTGAETQTLTCKINYAKRNLETNPNNNMATVSVTPIVDTQTAELDYGVFFTDVSQSDQDSYGTADVWWANWTGQGGQVLCELYLDGECVWSQYKSFGAYESIDQSFEIYYAGNTSRTLEARINYANKDREADPNDNLADTIVTPTKTKDDTYDFSVSDLSLSPSVLYQGEYVSVSFVSDNWNKDLAYEDVPVEVLVDDKVVKTECVDFAAYGRNQHRYSICLSDIGYRTIKVRINWGNRFGESNTYNNSVISGVEVLKYYEFSVSDLQVNPTGCYAGETISVSFRTDSWDGHNAYESIPVELLYNGEVIHTEYVDYPAYGRKMHSVQLQVGTQIGSNDISARVNWDAHAEEVNPDNNETAAVQLTVNPQIDIGITAVLPNSNYRAGMTVVTSYFLHNYSDYPIIPNHHNTVSFEAYYFNGTSKIVISSQTWMQAVIPASDNNLVYFKWTVPSDIAGQTVYCKAVVNSENGFDEYDTSNNIEILTQTVTKVNVSQTPDTQYEVSKPNGFVIPTAPSARTDSARWSLWTYDNGTFIKENYGIAISNAVPSITPDEDSPSAVNKNGEWQMRSGYGIYLRYAPSITGIGGYSMPPDTAYTAVQSAEAFFPESRYVKAVGSFRTLEQYSGAWVFEQNTNVDLDERLHFIPLWYPDGNYTVSVVATDVWTPAGMISAVRNSKPINVVDSAYDDWYVGEE